MFAPMVAKPQTKAAASSTNSLAHDRPVPKQSIGNQTTLRLLAQHPLRLGANGSGEHQEPAVDREPHARRGLSWDFRKIPVFPPNRTSGPQTPLLLPAPLMPAMIQPKLVVGEANDPLEHEADRVADQVMRMPDAALPFTSALPQVSRKCVVCEQEQKLQKEPAVRQASSGDAPDLVNEVLRSPGQPLDAATRAFMGARFVRDFSQVRLHTDAKAAESARAVNALAYTVGHDVVFGAGTYKPETFPGQRLLAHELAHVVQQGGTPRHAGERESDHIAKTGSQQVFGGTGQHHTESKGDQNSPAQAQPHMPALGRTEGETPVLHYIHPAVQRQPPGPPGPQPWAQCPADKTGQLNSELGEAVAWVNQAISDLQTADRPARTNGALGRYLSTDPVHIASTILPKLTAILGELNLGVSNFQCQTEQQCLAAFPGGANAYSGHPITLCPGYFDKDGLGRPTTLIHEAGHNAGLAGNVVEWQWPFPGLDVPTRLGNTESYAAFVRSNSYPELAPYQQTGGFQLGVGSLFPGGGISPRFLVTAELDGVLKQRIVRFFDLRLGVRVDVDTSGTILGSATLGSRVFAPVSISQTPLFLDLRGGVVVGRAADVGPRFEAISPVSDINVLGASGEARIGILKGNFGGTIGYRHIWNMVKNNPDLNEVTISGEIRF
jgi:hypothetical protein